MPALITYRQGRVLRRSSHATRDAARYAWRHQRDRHGADRAEVIDGHAIIATYPPAPHPAPPEPFDFTDIEPVPGATVRWWPGSWAEARRYRCVGRVVGIDPDGALRVGYTVQVNGGAYATRVLRIPRDRVLDYSPPRVL